MLFCIFTGKDYPVDFKRVYDHVRAISPYENEKPLDADSVKKCTEDMLSAEEYKCFSKEFKAELM